MNHPTASYFKSQKTIGIFLVKDNYKSHPPHHHIFFAMKIQVSKMSFNIVKNKQAKPPN